VSRPGSSTGHPLLERLAAALDVQPGRPATFEGSPARAAVAVVFRVGADGAPELLLILRAEREGDPWSGHVALPGGRMQGDDATLQDTAIRETREETSVDLATHGTVLGTLDELHPRTPTLPPIVVTPYVFVVSPDVEPAASEDVAEAFWVPWATLVDPAVTRESTVRARGAEWRVPSYVVGRHIVWGMTERILRNLTTLLA
jgi:8-oxo-dGTP pyrophosphatase MutT (NUDIX family)